MHSSTDTDRESQSDFVAKVFFGLTFLLYWPLAIFAALQKNPWQDEILTLYDSRRPLSSLLGSPFSHKGYILCVKLSTALFGESVLAWRLPAILFGGLALWMVFVLGRRMFSPQVGLLAAILVMLHAMFLFFATDARGYIGAAALVLVGIALLWAFLERGKWTLGVASVVVFYLAFRMHPTAALLYPGIFLYLCGTLPVRFVKYGWMGNRAYLGALLASVLVAAALFAPRFLEYRRWNSFLVPQFITGETSLVAATPSLSTGEGWLYHLAPFVVARGHQGTMVWVGLILFLLGALPLERGKTRQGLYLFLPVASLFVFFLAYNPNFLPDRYLFPAFPLFTLLVAAGIQRLTGWVLFPWRNRRGVPRARAALAAAVVILFGAACLKPLGAEVLYGGYGDRWMVPMADLLKSERFQQSSLWVVEESPFPRKKDDAFPFWKKLLVTLRVDPRKVEVRDLKDSPPADVLAASLEPGRLVLTRDSASASALEPALTQAGFEHFQIGPATLFAPATADPAEGSGVALAAVLEFLDPGLASDPDFLGSVADLYERLTLPQEAERYRHRSLRIAARLVRWDFPRSAGRWTSALAKEAQKKSDLIEAGQWYAFAFGRKESRLHDYIGYLSNIPNEEQNQLCRDGIFRTASFVEGFRRKLVAESSQTAEYRAYWAFRGAQVAERCGGVPASVPLYEFSAQQGDSFGRSSQRLYDYFSKSRESEKKAAAYFQAYRAGSAQIELYVVFFKENARDHWLPFVEDNRFPIEAFTEGFLEALKRGEKKSIGELRRWGPMIVAVFEEAGRNEQAARLRSALPEEASK